MSDSTTPIEGFTSMWQDSHTAPAEQQIIELYSLIGHQIERIIRRDERTSDFIIKAKDGEKRVTRCELRDEVDDTHVKALYQVMRDEGAAQAALITTGSLSAQAQRFARGKPIRLADWSEFESLLRRARAQAQKKEQTPAASPIQPETLKPRAETDTPFAKPYNTWAANSLLFRPKYVALLGGILLILGSFLPWATWSNMPDPLVRTSFEQSPDRPLTLVIGIIAVIGALAAKEVPGRNGSLPAASCGVWVIGIALHHYLRLFSAGLGFVRVGILLSSAGAIVAIIGGYQHNPGAVTERSTPSVSLGSWIDVWIKAVTRPVVATFEAIAKDPNRTSTRAYGWVFVASLIGIVVQVVAVQLPAGRLFAGALPTCAHLPLVPFFLVWMCVPLPLDPFLLVLGLALSGGITNWLARRLGGFGTYSQLIYAYAAYSAPLILIGTVVGAVPYPLLISLSLGLSIYGLVLQVVALKAVHQIGWTRAIAAASGSLVLILFVACAVLYIYLSPLRNWRFF